MLEKVHKGLRIQSTIITLIAFHLFIWGIITKLSPIILFATLLLSILLGNIILKLNSISRTTEIIFTILIVSSSLSIGFELQSDYLLGNDVQGEYYYINLLKLGLVKPGELGTYSDILFFHYNFITLESITGMHLIRIMKIIGAFIISLIPLTTYLYVFVINKKKEPALIASIAIMIQTSYIVTLHSTLKQAITLFITPLLMTALYRVINASNKRDIVVYLLLLLAIVGHYYTIPGIITFSMLLSIVLHELDKSLNRKKEIYSGKILYIVTILSFIIWFAWYAVFTTNILEALIQLATRAVGVEPAEYYEYNTPHPLIIDRLRYIVNATFIGTIVLGTLSEKMFVNRNTMNTRVFEIMIIAFKLMLIISIVIEFTKISTIGLGRIFINYLTLLSPVVYYGFRKIWEIILQTLNLISLNSLKLEKFYIKFSILILILFTLRFLITVGTLSFIVGTINNIPFYDSTYGIKNSPINADLLAISFINEHVGDESVIIATDFKSVSRLSYVPYLRFCAHTVYSYFNPKVFNYYDTQYDYFIIYLSSYNIKLGELYAAHNLYLKTDYYLPHLLNKNIIFDSGLTMVILHIY